ncbi:hypothetical protein EAY64_19505 [Aquitalea palustris]|uniref:Uncharacterized protein n=1 Tax=Aquitalea palustris TaxID=2480983 RepID=A0A454JD63_9NEIS|nr:hypothetical protein EAY64_19505 [Aquitalea palustris]
MNVLADFSTAGLLAQGTCRQRQRGFFLLRCGKGKQESLSGKGAVICALQLHDEGQRHRRGACHRLQPVLGRESCTMVWFFFAAM